MIRNGFICRKIMVQAVYVLSFLIGQYLRKAIARMSLGDAL